MADVSKQVSVGDKAAGPAVASGASLALDEDAIPARRLGDQAPHGFGGSLADTLRHTRGRGALEIGLIVLLLQVGCVVAYLVAPTEFPYLSTANLNVLTQSIPVLGILAVGAGILMVTGEFDLSLGMSYTFCALVFVNWYSSGANPVVAVVVAIGAGVAIAVLNGLIVTKFGIPSFIVTLGAMLFWDGAALFYNGTTAALMDRGPVLETIFVGQVGPVRGQILWLAAVGAFFWTLMHRHRSGNHMFAVGGNESAAKAISINPKRVKVRAFAILGGLVGLAGVLAAIRVESVQPGIGRGLELEAIAAAVVGGTSLRGGKGSVLGMILGAVLIKTVEDILRLTGAPGFYLDLFVGAIIVAAAIFNRMIEGKAE